MLLLLIQIRILEILREYRYQVMYDGKWSHSNKVREFYNRVLVNVVAYKLIMGMIKCLHDNIGAGTKEI